MTGLIRYTTAPEAYDGFGTRTARVAGDDGGKPIRMVLIESDALQWQDTRYASGMHCCWTQEMFDRACASGLVNRVA